jgi:selenophosphate synthetase-related protein
VEVLKVEGLDAVHSIEVGATVLDVLVREDMLYVSVDAKEGDWIVEYRYVDGEWKRTDTSKWRITQWEESKAELYYLEANRKRTGSHEDD